MARKFKRSPLALAILALLHEAPMHPYRMQRLIKDRGKDQVINVGQRASLYQTIDQLLRAGLITLWETTRAEGFPERTVYRLTEAGHEAAVDWLREMVSTPDQDFPEFPAAVSLLPLLTPEDALAQMILREAALSEQIAQLDQEIQTSTESGLPRLFLLESEVLRTVRDAELAWVRSIIDDLRSGALTWHHDWLKPFAPPENEE
ncbi:MAG: PadR family transcriptional regulator [Chloroflexi bacterium]|nr:PadR family transcriptional regulator [Chloroflexota bacterium]